MKHEYKIEPERYRHFLGTKFDFDYVPNIGDAFIDCFSFGTAPKPYIHEIYEWRIKYNVYIKKTKQTKRWYQRKYKTIEYWYLLDSFNDIEEANTFVKKLKSYCLDEAN